MMCLTLTRFLLALFASLAALAVPAFGHSAEQGFILLLPTDIYITAGTAAVAASVVLVSVMGRQIPIWMSRHVPIKILQFKPNSIASLLSTAAVFVLIWIGLTGPRDPLGNILPLTIWTVWWIGLVACSVIFGDIWRHINPWSGLYDLLSGTEKSPFTLPDKFEIWPAVLVFTAFHIFAIADIAPSDPYRLATVVAGYWIFTFIGMLLFGGKSWLERVECFSVFFKLLSSLAPAQNAKLGLPGWATLTGRIYTSSYAAFCIVMLGAGSFDGLHETFWWLAQIGINPLEFPGRSAVFWTSTLGMLATCLALAVVFAASVWIGTILAADPSITLKHALPAFAVSLIPIAFGYHFAHYLTSFLVGVQYSAIAASDPFATGADYLGMARLQVTTGFLNAPSSVKLIWLTQAAAVVISHIIAVMMAHTVAAKLYNTSRQILLSQSALSVLMIAYTVFGLWLLASPRGV